MENLKKETEIYLKERGWLDLHPADLAKSIVIESAELLEIFQWDNTRKDVDISVEQLERVKCELADVIIYCLDMGIILDLDLDKIVRAKLAKVKEKYPQELFSPENSDKKNSQKLYQEIKESYRRR